jgi:tRNA (uracil-5-)-methyltransferase TRM9
LQGAQGPILDLGCGNGWLAKELAERGIRAPYLGVDFSRSLLQEAFRSMPEGFKAEFRMLDLTAPDWKASPAGEDLSRLSPFQFCLAFAVLHHIPGSSLRLSVVQNARQYLETGSLFIHSVWQFLNSPRLKRRVQPWHKAGIHPEQVDPGDYLLDWRHGGEGLRYVHHFNAEELEGLARAAGFTIRDQFHSDGEGGSLGLYQVWEAD